MSEIPFPIPREEARLDVAHARKTIARLERKKAALTAKVSEVEQSIKGAEHMLRTIFGVYPDLNDAPVRTAAIEAATASGLLVPGQVCGRCGHTDWPIAGHFLGVPVCVACDEQQGWHGQGG